MTLHNIVEEPTGDLAEMFGARVMLRKIDPPLKSDESDICADASVEINGTNFPIAFLNTQRRIAEIYLPESVIGVFFSGSGEINAYHQIVSSFRMSRYTLRFRSRLSSD
jgi:hypothetical protein